MKVLGLFYILLVVTVIADAASVDRKVKVLRIRWFRDPMCMNPVGPESTKYASTDGSSLCYNKKMALSRESKSCLASTGVVIGNFYNATFCQANSCSVDDDESYFYAGTMETCEQLPTNFSLFADVIYLREPLYAWEWMLVGLGCLVIVLLVVAVTTSAVLYKMRSRIQRTTHESLMEREMVQ